MWGKTHTPKARKRISEANKGKKLSPEHIQKLIKANTGRVKSKHELEICKNNISNLDYIEYQMYNVSCIILSS